MLVTVNPGVYTAVVSPASTSANQDGIGLIEVYDTTPGVGSKLVNLSTRGRIETGNRQMIVGVVVSGSGHDRLMIRGSGPALKPAGVSDALANPSMQLYQNAAGKSTVIGSNDDWGISSSADQDILLANQLGAFALASDSADSVILANLAPGVYTTIIAPSNDTPGIALAEIYDANTP
jgi:hypothetical protein